MFDAPRELMFQAWTQCSASEARWWGPGHGFTNPVCEVDLRGAALRVADCDGRTPDGIEFPGGGVYREIVPPERLVFTNCAWDQEGTLLLEALTTVTFADEGGKTKLTLHSNAAGFLLRPRCRCWSIHGGWLAGKSRAAGILAGERLTAHFSCTIRHRGFA